MWGDFNYQDDEIYKFLTYLNKVGMLFYILSFLIINYFRVVVIYFWKNISIIVLWECFVMFWKRSNEFILLNVNLFDLGSNSANKSAYTLC